MTRTAAPSCWIPERLVRTDGGVRCEWLDAGDLRFTDPFFETTLARLRRHRPERRSLPLQHLHDAAAAVPALQPSAFVFHVSRCGSTLLSQLFACSDMAVVLSEVPLLDELLRSDFADREALYTSALRLLGRRRFSDDERLVVKTDCWHLFYAADLRRLYPDTPFVLLYRAPEAVLASHRRARGIHVVPGLLTPAPFAVEYDPARLTLDQYAAAVLERHYRAMLDVAATDARAMLVSYGEGFPAAFERIVRRLDFPIDDRFVARVHERCSYDGKDPGAVFHESQRAALSGVDIQPVRQLFDRLEDMRTAGAGRD